MTEEEVVEKKEATTTKNNREQSKFQTRKTENYYQQCWIQQQAMLPVCLFEAKPLLEKGCEIILLL